MASQSENQTSNTQYKPKATIYIHDQQGNFNKNNKIEVLFNPQNYTIDRSNQFASMAIPGRQSPIIQFVRGESETLTVELFFDTFTYYEKEDVRNYTRKITRLLDIDTNIHAPPICTFAWGDVDQKDSRFFTGIIEKATTTYTMFLADGRPVRAKMNLTFRQFQTPEQQPKLNSSDKTKRITLMTGDSLWLISAKEYGDPGKWRTIADVNNIDDPETLEPGREIVIPILE